MAPGMLQRTRSDEPVLGEMVFALPPHRLPAKENLVSTDRAHGARSGPAVVRCVVAWRPPQKEASLVGWFVATGTRLAVERRITAHRA